MAKGTDYHKHSDFESESIVFRTSANVVHVVPSIVRPSRKMVRSRNPGVLMDQRKRCREKQDCRKIISQRKSISSRPPDLAPGGRFLHPDGGIRPSRAPGFSFPPGFGPKSIRRAQANPGPLRRARGLRTRENGNGPALSERERANRTIWTQIPLSLSSLLCRRRHHPSPIRQPVS
jgi:hypothetical protein